MRKLKNKPKGIKQSDILMEFVIYHERTNKLRIATVVRNNVVLKDNARDKKTLFESVLIGVL